MIALLYFLCDLLKEIWNLNGRMFTNVILEFVDFRTCKIERLNELGELNWSDAMSTGQFMRNCLDGKVHQKRMVLDFQSFKI